MEFGPLSPLEFGCRSAPIEVGAQGTIREVEAAPDPMTEASQVHVPEEVKTAEPEPELSDPMRTGDGGAAGRRKAMEDGGVWVKTGESLKRTHVCVCVWRLCY